MLETFATITEVIVELHTTTASAGDSDSQELQRVISNWESALTEYISLSNDCANDIGIGAGANITDESVDCGSGLIELIQERCHDSMQSPLATATVEGSKLELQDVVKNAFTVIEEVVECPLPQPKYPKGKR